jgi:hypothetical protein
LLICCWPSAEELFHQMHWRGKVPSVVKIQVLKL